MSNLKTVLKSSALALIVGLAFAAPASADGGYGNGGTSGAGGGGHGYGQRDDDGDGDLAITDDQAYFYGEGYTRSRDYDGPRYDGGDRRGGGRHDRDGHDGRGGRDGGGHHAGRGGDRYSDGWERGWRAWDGYYQHAQHGTLNKWRLKRRLERQGFSHIRDLRPSRYGFGWRAFARDRYGDAVVLRVDPYSGRVLGARYV